MTGKHFLKLLKSWQGYFKSGQLFLLALKLYAKLG